MWTWSLILFILNLVLTLFVIFKRASLIKKNYFELLWNLWFELDYLKPYSMDATASQNQCIQLVETSIEEHQKGFTDLQQSFYQITQADSNESCSWGRKSSTGEWCKKTTWTTTRSTRTWITSTKKSNRKQPCSNYGKSELWMWNDFLVLWWTIQNLSRKILATFRGKDIGHQEEDTMGHMAMKNLRLKWKWTFHSLMEEWMLKTSWIGPRMWRIFLNIPTLTITKKVKLVVFKLQGGAAAWWDQLEGSRWYYGKQAIKDWPKMLRLMRKRFLPINYQLLTISINNVSKAIGTSFLR